MRPVYINGPSALYVGETHAVVHGALDAGVCHCLLTLLAARTSLAELILHEASGTIDDAFPLLHCVATVGVRATGTLRGVAALLTFCGAPGRRWAGASARFELTVDNLGGPPPGRSGVELGDVSMGKTAWARAMALRCLTIYLMGRHGLDGLRAMDWAEQGIVADASAAAAAGHVDGIAAVDVVLPVPVRPWSFDLPCARPA